MSVWHLNLGEHWTPDNTTLVKLSPEPCPAPAWGHTVTANLFICHGDCCGHQRSAGDCYLGLASVGVQCGARHTTHQDLVTVVTAPVTRWLHISIHCLPVLCCKHAHTALTTCPRKLILLSTYIQCIYISSRVFCKAIFIGLSNWFIIPILMSAA